MKSYSNREGRNVQAKFYFFIKPYIINQNN